MRVLVTGGAGYIGSHTCKLLNRAGNEPVTFDNLSTGHRWAVKWGPLVTADLSDIKALAKALRQYQIEAVIHFAASAYVGESMSNPRQYYRNNVVNSLNLLDAMVDQGIDRIVFSSSCAVYGQARSLPITEQHPKCPISPYGESKFSVERALRWYASAYGLKWVALRYFNAAGSDPDGEVGEQHDPETHLIPLAIQAALRRSPPITIFGTDYPTPDGTPIRDYVHVSDLAEAHLLALDYASRNDSARVFNLGTGLGSSVFDVVQAIEATAQVSVPYHCAPRRAGDPPDLRADGSLARTLLGWTCRLSNLSSIVRTALVWARRDHGETESVAPTCCFDVTANQQKR